jgi:hypothetical protein
MEIKTNSHFSPQLIRGVIARKLTTWPGAKLAPQNHALQGLRGARMAKTGELLVGDDRMRLKVDD